MRIEGVFSWTVGVGNEGEVDAHLLGSDSYRGTGSGHRRICLDPLSADDVPTKARRLAVDASQRESRLQDVDVWVAVRDGNCAAVELKRSDSEVAGPSVSLENINDKWIVRRIGMDFDADSIRGVEGRCP